MANHIHDRHTDTIRLIRANATPRCRHIKINGTRCASPALRPQPAPASPNGAAGQGGYCFYHHQQRRRPERLRLPILEDTVSVQAAIAQVCQAAIDGALEPKIASLVLYGLQTASSNCRHTLFAPFTHHVVTDLETLQTIPYDLDQDDDDDYDDEENDQDDADEEDEENDQDDAEDEEDEENDQDDADQEQEEEDDQEDDDQDDADQEQEGDADQEEEEDDDEEDDENDAALRGTGVPPVVASDVPPGACIPPYNAIAPPTTSPQPPTPDDDADRPQTPPRPPPRPQIRPCLCPAPGFVTSRPTRGTLLPSMLRALKSLFLLLALLLLSLPAVAQQRDWRIQNFHSDIIVHADGSADVHEHLTMLFNGTYHGIDRFIPTDYPNKRTGGNYSIDLSVKDVTDDSGNKLKYDDKHSSGSERLRIYIPGAVNTTKTVVIHYSVLAASRYFKDYDEFYWNVTGNDWRVPIDAASATVHFPETAHDLRAQAFTGAYGSTGRDALARISGSTVEFASNNPLSAREGLTIDVALPKGILHQPSGLVRAWRFAAANTILLLPIWTFLVMFAVKRKKGGSANPALAVAPQYEPPKDMPPAECGTLIDDKTNPRDITSTLVDLAVRGYLKIREIAEKHLLHTSKDYELQLLKPQDQWGPLAPYEQIMLTNVFSNGDTTLVSSLRNRFYVAIPKIKETVLSELDRKGMYAVDPSQAIGYVVFGVIISALPFVAASFLFGANFSRSGLWMFVAIAIAAVITFFFARHMSATTLQGSRTKVQILGFREFLSRVDTDRLKRMPPDTFEKYLAYAMAFGVEQHWAKAFSGLIQNPPTWYEGYYPGAFNTMYFTQSLTSMVATTGSAFVEAPHADSSGSGFGGGGGFSGGGFGGGGGDAF